MQFDLFLFGQEMGSMPALARAAEELGFDGLWTAETAHNPFLPLALAAEHTQRLSLGTGIAVAFPRSPTVLAHIAWDLQRYSQGRFILGLGTQVKAHIVLRFGSRWDKPVRQMRETIEAMRAVWGSWRAGGTSLNYRGEYYTLRLMTPFFAEPPLAYPDPPVYVAAVTVDLVTYETRVDDFVALQEVGKVINPVLAAGQIEGGVAQAIGYALYENVVYREGRMVNNQMTNYIMPTSADLPPIRVYFAEQPYAYGPAGAKGIGELPMDGPAPAILNAIEDATGVACNQIPLLPETLMPHLVKRATAGGGNA